MRRARARRRRLVLGVLFGLAIAAFALGAALGGRSGTGGGAAHPSASAPSSPPRLSLPLSRLAGERIVTGFPGATVPPQLAAAIRAGRVAGVVLFAENLPSRPAARQLIAALQALLRPGRRQPLLVMLDQEGGEVKRVDGPPSASAAAMGRRGAAFSREQGKLTAASLRRLGINVDLAPVLDVARPGGEIATTERGFGSAPGAVAATAVPFAAALQAGGVAATGKHFPGFGAAAENTDFETQRIGLSKRELHRDEAPFRAFVAAGGELVMLSTAVYPALSPLPAALARPIASGELRGRLGFRGVSITDSLDSAAASAFGGPGKVGLAAARAGTDLLLFPDLEAAARAQRELVRRLRSQRLRRGEFEASVRRVLALRTRLGRS